jgi:hypothetical protein
VSFSTCVACCCIPSRISSVYLPVMQDLGQIRFVNSFGVPSKTCCRKPIQESKRLIIMEEDRLKKRGCGVGVR